jgi:hypothetical protein
MRTLKVKVESQKLIKGQQQLKRLTEKEIKSMKINDIEKNCKMGMVKLFFGALFLL